MSVGQWLAFGSLLSIVLFTPGPDFVLILRHSLADRRTGAVVAAGVISGLFVHTACRVTWSLRTCGDTAAVALRAHLRRGGISDLARHLRDSKCFQGPSLGRGNSGSERTDRGHHSISLRLPLEPAEPEGAVVLSRATPAIHRAGEGAGLRTLMLAGATVVAAALWWAIVVVLAAGAGKKLRRPGVGKRIDVVTGVLLVGLGAFFGVA